MPAPDLSPFAEFASSLADVAGAIIRAAAAHERRFDSKADRSPVTAIDQHVERRLREAIGDRFPGHGVLGEEYASTGLDSEWVWVIDPIDGTKAFITGIPTYGTLIALAHGGRPVLGVIDNPITRERWVGGDGVPATRNGHPVRTRDCVSLADATLGNGNPEPFGDAERTAFERLRAEVRWCVYGGGCHAYGRVADGALDISLDAGLDAFDYCALAPVVRAAGGAVSDWDGRELTISSGSLCVASATPALHDQALIRLDRRKRAA